MRALVNTPGGPTPVTLRDAPEPAPTPNEALVAVKAFSLNRGELASFARNKEGWIPSQDIAGVVLTAAANGMGPPAGTRVVALVDEFGWAERVAVPANRLVPLPDHVSFAAASTLPVAGLTALRCLRLGGALVGRRVLITGAAGGVGMLAVQIAVHSGALVTGVAVGADRTALVRRLGAHEVVEDIAHATGRFSLILEAAGGDSLRQALKLIEPHGTIALYGNSAATPAEISFQDFRAAQNARIQSFFYFTSGPEEMFGPDLALLVSLVAAGHVKPVVGEERDWSELLSIGERLRGRRVAGKAVFLTGV
jgi:NADPH:quinone reductase-like Zn-dependent oxidoreductase